MREAGLPPFCFDDDADGGNADGANDTGRGVMGRVRVRSEGEGPYMRACGKREEDGVMADAVTMLPLPLTSGMPFLAGAGGGGRRVLFAGPTGNVFVIAGTVAVTGDGGRDGLDGAD